MLEELNLELVMRKILLSRGKFALVDNEDYEYLNQWKWCYSSTKHLEYAKRYAYFGRANKKPIRQMVLMHRLLMKAAVGDYVDHVNHNGLDNRKSNLRICTQSQNMANSIKSKNTSSRYKGVHWSVREKRWVAKIKHNGVFIFLGQYRMEEQAARSYNKAAQNIFKEFARCNDV